jgi:hypothetical protein
VAIYTPQEPQYSPQGAINSLFLISSSVHPSMMIFLLRFENKSPDDKPDDSVKSRWNPKFVIPVETGIQYS